MRVGHNFRKNFFEYFLPELCAKKMAGFTRHKQNQIKVLLNYKTETLRCAPSHLTVPSFNAKRV